METMYHVDMPLCARTGRVLWLNSELVGYGGWIHYCRDSGPLWYVCEVDIVAWSLWGEERHNTYQIVVYYFNLCTLLRLDSC